MEWVTKGLDEALFIQEGPGIRKYEYEDDGYPMINVRCVQDGYVDMSKSRSANYELATTKWKHFQVEENDILYTISGTIGRSAIVKKSDLPLLMNTSVVRFRSLTECLDTKFVYYAFKTDTFINELLGHSTGTAIKNVGPSHLKKMTISYPPLKEQKRIVALLDTVFADLEQARAKTEQNLKNARELFDSYLQQVFSQKGEGWVQDKLKSVCRLINGRAYKKPEMLSEGKYPLLRVGNFFTNRSWYYSDLELHEDKYCNNGDLLYAWSASFGPRIWEGGKTIYHYHIWKTDIKKDLVLKHFLFYWFHWDATNVKKEHGTGSTMIHVSMTSMNARNISYPSIKEQTNIVDKLQSLDSSCKELESIYTEKLASIDEFKKSILQKAFSGELTTTAE